jgi:hypothetical protein
MQDIQELLAASDEEALAASGVLNYDFPESIVDSVALPSADEA